MVPKPESTNEDQFSTQTSLRPLNGMAGKFDEHRYIVWENHNTQCFLSSQRLPETSKSYAPWRPPPPMFPNNMCIDDLEVLSSLSTILDTICSIDYEVLLVFCNTWLQVRAQLDSLDYVHHVPGQRSNPHALVPSIRKGRNSN
jgi:hypothetical protein